jgi:hypothetical protein
MGGHSAIRARLENLETPLSKWLNQLAMTALRACTLLAWQLPSVKTAHQGNILTKQDPLVAQIVRLAHFRTKKAQKK